MTALIAALVAAVHLWARRDARRSQILTSGQRVEVLVTATFVVFVALASAWRLLP